MQWFWTISFLIGGAIAAAGAHAEDHLGTAGPFRSASWARCEAGFVAQFNGDCDPPAVDQSLPPQQQSQAHVERALKLIALGRMTQAKASLDDAVRTDPRNLMAHKLRARSKIPGNLSEAEADINAGLLLDPDDSDLLATRAMLLVNRNDRTGLSEADRAIAIKPDNTDALFIRGRIMLQLNRQTEAEADFTNALALEPDHFEARHLRGAVRLHLGRYRDAFDDADIVVKQRPGNVSALHLRAMARAGMGDYAGLVSDLTVVLGDPGQPINADPSLPLFNGLYLQRAIALVQLRRPREAMQDIDTLTRLGGQRAILRMQVYLRSHGFPDLPLDGKRSDLLDDAMKACFIDRACGRGIAEHI